MLIRVEQTGFSRTLQSPIYTETRICNRCGNTRVFSYSCCWDLANVEKGARQRYQHSAQGDVCSDCRELLARGFRQLRLF